MSARTRCSKGPRTAGGRPRNPDGTTAHGAGAVNETAASRPSAPGGVRSPAPRSRAHRRGPETPTRPKPCYLTSIPRSVATSTRCRDARTVQAASADRTSGRAHNVRQQARASRRSRCPALRSRPRHPAQHTRSRNLPRVMDGRRPIQRRCSDARDVPSCRGELGLASIVLARCSALRSGTTDRQFGRGSSGGSSVRHAAE